MAENEDYTNDYLIFLLGLYALYEENRISNEEVWTRFNTDILHNHRFFPEENEIIKTIRESANSATIYYNKGQILYRARIFKGDPYASFMELYRKELGFTKEEWRVEKAKVIQNESIFLTQISLLEFVDKDHLKNNPDTKPLLQAIRKWQKVKFKGYNSKESLAPPPSVSVAGRANPEGISYTYLCEDENTPVYEVRPTINQIVSVAKFKLNRQLKIFDINYAMEQLEFPPLFSTISEKFSMPYNGNPAEYLPTQYLTELIRTMGFDGIRFNSSLHENGKNVVLFAADYKVISSKLVTVKKYDLEIDQHDIYTLTQKS